MIFFRIIPMKKHNHFVAWYQLYRQKSRLAMRYVACSVERLFAQAIVNLSF